MRLALVLVVALSTSVPAPAQSRDACLMVSAADMETILGSSPQISEQSGAGTGISACQWRGTGDKIVRLTSITAQSQGIVGGTPLDYFNQGAAYRKAELAGMVSDLQGPWQAGIIVDIVENNPDQAVSISFINKDDTVTLDTFFIDRSDTIDLAGKVAAGM